MPRLLAFVPPALLLVVAGAVHLAVRQAVASADLAELRLEAAREAAREGLVAAAPRRDRREHLAGLRAQVAARADTTRHLRLHPTEGWGELRQGPHPLRRFPLETGPAPVSSGSVHFPLFDYLPLALPTVRPAPGSYRVLGAWGAHPPPALSTAAPATEAPWPEGAPDKVWDVFLFDDTLVYSATPPIPYVAGPALPGTIRIGEMDLAAILPNLSPGVTVHVW